MRFIVTLLAVALVAASAAADVDVGLVDQKAPKKEDLAAPAKDAKPQEVDLQGSFKGKTTKGEKRNVYFLICPLGKKGDGGKDWWAQGEVSKDGEAVSAYGQFGEENSGSGEWFAVVAVATDKTFGVGEKLDALPDDAAFSKVVVVKRK
jgi:hypothetical protein